MGELKEMPPIEERPQRSFPEEHEAKVIAFPENKTVQKTNEATGVETMPLNKLVSEVAAGRILADEQFIDKTTLSYEEKNILRTVQELRDANRRLANAYIEIQNARMERENAPVNIDPRKVVETRVDDAGKLRAVKPDIAS